MGFTKRFWLLSVFLFVSVSSIQLEAARIARITTHAVRAEQIETLDHLLHPRNEELREQLVYFENPFFFEQPLMLRMRAPGGIQNAAVLRAIGSQMLRDISGAIVRGNRSSLIMRQGVALFEGDTVSRALPEFAGMEAQAVIVEIHPDRFVLRLNETTHTVVIAER